MGDLGATYVILVRLDCGKRSRFARFAREIPDTVCRIKYCHKSWGLDGLVCLWSYDGIAKKIIKKAKYKYFYDVLGELINLPEGEEYFYFRKFLENKPGWCRCRCMRRDIGRGV